MNDDTFEKRFSKLPAKDLARRARSIAVMRAEGVPVNEWLPILEMEDNVELPTTEQVAMRAAATLLVAMKGHGLPQERVELIAGEFQLARWFSPKEAGFINDPNPTERDRQIQTWRYEAANALLWAVSTVAELGGPRTLIDPGHIALIILDHTREQFIESVSLRPKPEILDQADLIYRYRWALVDARLHGREPPAGLNPDVAMERHQVFNWLIEHADTDWDDISLDT